MEILPTWQVIYICIHIFTQNTCISLKEKSTVMSPDLGYSIPNTLHMCGGQQTTDTVDIQSMYGSGLTDHM